ncbi:MAG: cysteine--tRNA ligase [Chloroflexi bacterium]|nr:cysteine--tRNA ligase [Chloroflexota bacterium]
MGGLSLFNTLSGEKEPFSSPNNTVRMYVCGITPYAPSHIGHAMFSVVFDVVRRFLEFKGFVVNHVQNFTDIDDKMIAAAAEMGITIEELAESNIQQYLEEMDALNVKRAHEYPRATKEMPKIVEMIEGLIEKKYAYSVNGNVYFRVRSDEDYGKLSGRSFDEMMAGARVEVDEAKEDPMDFALWKSQKPGEPAWESPWGPGRPGWHIECSAMSLKYLGENLDIHGGGRDLIFPHHENEIAQTESFTDCEPFVRFWMHNGFLSIGEDKMSKSLGNVISVQEALGRFTPAAIRMFFLSSHYRNPLMYNDQNIASQDRAVERLRNALSLSGAVTSDIEQDPASYRERFVEAMDDDLNTPRALAVLFDLARDINRGRDEGEKIARSQDALRELAGVLGLDLDERVAETQADIAPFVELLIEMRADLRSAKQYAMADKVRDRLTELGVILEDKSQGTEWKLRSS